MTGIPQPSPEPYAVGDRVLIYLSPDDVDDQFHDTVCCVIDVTTDDLSTETDRVLDAYSYSLRTVEGGEELPITFRHWDLVPV
jgi:hypothetical protein